MRNRFPSSESLHDRVIGVVGQAQTKHDVFTNPGHSHNWSVKIDGEDVYPDLILCKKGSKVIEHLIEVETEESVTDAESSQWAQYARGPGKFWLMVPSKKLSTAQSICSRKGIAAQFGQWWVANGSLRFEWLQHVAAYR